MPKISKVFEIDITPERFIDACSDTELKELDLLLSSARFQQRLKATEIGFQQSSKDTPLEKKE